MIFQTASEDSKEYSPKDEEDKAESEHAHRVEGGKKAAATRKARAQKQVTWV